VARVTKSPAGTKTKSRFCRWWWLVIGCGVDRSPTTNHQLARVGKVEELLPRLRVVLERSADRARDRLRVLFFDAAHHHAEVIRFDDDADARGLKHFVQGTGDLFRETLLHLEPARKDIDN